MPSELTVILKDESRTYREVFLIYDIYTAQADDPKVMECIQTAVKQFGSTPDSIKVKISIEVQ